MSDSLIFYDTCSLLLAQREAFNNHFYISLTTLQELEKIKNSRDRDESVKSAARAVVRLLYANPDSFTVVLLKETDVSNDEQIIRGYLYQKSITENLKFCTNDLSCALIAQGYYGVSSDDIISYQEGERYTGYKIIEHISDEELAYFYEHIDENIFDLVPNQYLYITPTDEVYIWRHMRHFRVFPITFKSQIFGSIEAYKNDIYQIMAMDSLKNNKITLLRGKAGSGKSYLALGYLFSILEKGEIDKIIIFCNTVAVAGAARLGFYPGTRTEKLLDSQIGNFLISKLGDRLEVDRLIKEDKIELLPLADIRGYDTTGLNAGVYITEAQNLDRNLIKLALQRIGEDCVCILDGDDLSQVDLPQYGGENNGIKSVVKVFKGEPIFGTVSLEQIHRSQIAIIADKI